MSFPPVTPDGSSSSFSNRLALVCSPRKLPTLQLAVSVESLFSECLSSQCASQVKRPRANILGPRRDQKEEIWGERRPALCPSPSSKYSFTQSIHQVDPGRHYGMLMGPSFFSDFPRTYNLIQGFPQQQSKLFLFCLT